MATPPLTRRSQPEDEYMTPPLTRRGPAEDSEPVAQRTEKEAGSASTSETESSYTDSEADSSDFSDSEGEVSERHVATSKSAVPRLGLGGLSLGGNVGVSEVPVKSSGLPAELAARLALPLGGDKGMMQISPALPRTGAKDAAETADSSNIPSATSNASLKVRRPSLQLPGSPVDRIRGENRGGDATPEGTASARERMLTVDLLSTGFRLNLPGGTSESPSEVGQSPNAASQFAAIRQRCVASLGVSPEDMCFYEIRKLEPGAEPSADCQHVAVAVKRSTFSLSALEDILVENKKLAATVEKSSAALGSLQNMVREQSQSNSKDRLRCAELEADNRRMKERMKGMEVHMEALKAELARSENLRLVGQKHLTELRREFESVTRDLGDHDFTRTFDASPRFDGGGTPSHRPPSAPVPTSSSSALLHSTRASSVLDRLCSDEVLSRLELCLGIIDRQTKPPSQ